MDPLSITASIITLFHAARSAISICQNYKAVVKEADWELPRILMELENLCNVLKDLELLAKRAETDDLSDVSWVPQLKLLCDPEKGTLASCFSEIQTLERKLTPPQWCGEDRSTRRRAVQALRWPLKKSYVKDICDNIQRYKVTLSVALGTNAVYVTSPLLLSRDLTDKDHLRKTMNSSTFSKDMKYYIFTV